MASFNRVTLIGNLTRDPELRHLPSGNTICDIGLASTRHYKTAGGEDREETCFIDCTAFGKQAEVLNQYVKKGRPIFIEGRLKYDTWDDKNGGGKRSKHTVVIENFQFLGSREGGEGKGDYPRTRQTVKSGGPTEAPFSEEPQFKDDDVPFRWEGRHQQLI